MQLQTRLIVFGLWTLLTAFTSIFSWSSLLAAGIYSPPPPPPLPPTPPVVSLSGPLNAAVGERDSVTLTFSEPMNPTTQRALTWTPRVSGTWRWIHGDSLQFAPAAPWPLGTETLRMDHTLVLSRLGSKPGRNLTWSLKTSPGLPVIWFVGHASHSVYITIDDGWFPSQRALKLVQGGLPITTFLIERAAQEHLGFWRALSAAGATIEDHTISHPYLTRIAPAEILNQIAQPIETYSRWFGQTPILLRPPYGAYNAAVEKAAARAGIRALVMWSAVQQNTKLTTWNGKPLAAGEIIILHWDPGLGRELQSLVKLIHARHLTVGALLPALSVCRPQRPNSGIQSGSAPSP